MRSPMPLYPVDRYLVQSNINNELVNIVNEDIWNPEPALRPEDEITLRKLHEMLRSTADDLRLLSGELAKYHEPGIQVKTMPTPLDEEFNEKVHIEEVVNAKFHGYKITDTNSTFTPSKNVQKDVVDGLIKTIADSQKRKHVVTTGVQVNQAPIKKTINKNLVKSQTKILQVNNGKGNIKNNNNKSNNLNIASSIGYNEFSYEYKEPNITLQTNKNLQLQELPKINIRSELKIQNVLQLDILPENLNKSNLQNLRDTNNTTVLIMKHESVPIENNAVNTTHEIKPHTLQSHPFKKALDRKISKMQTCESSESTEHLSSEIQRKTKSQKQIKRIRHTSPSVSTRNKTHFISKHADKQECPKTSLNEWKKKLNAVYGRPSTSKLKQPHSKNIKETRGTSRKNVPVAEIADKNGWNNAEYIPYSKLTLGGVSVSDIEKEISNIPDKGEMPLGPILEKILSSRENSFHMDSPRIHKQTNVKNILTTSDENLLKEVIDIQNKVSKSLSEDVEKKSLPGGESDTYADDFDDEKTDSTNKFSQQDEANKSPIDEDSSKESNKNNSSHQIDKEKIDSKIQNETFTKSNSLSFKNSVDIFEYVHEIDTQDSAIQINMSNKLSLKGTQTSPRSDKNNIQPIHNDLWPSIDQTKQAEQMFKLEKDFIKKLIIDELNLLQTTLNKPSTSGHINESSELNENSSQKNTQTSPAHVKNVMTSPIRTKTRTTSPLVLSSKIDRHTSPMTIKSDDEDVLKSDHDKPSISMNLSSPRFSLRLPQTSRDVISTLDTQFRQKDYHILPKHQRKPISSSSSSVDGDYSSSDISSLGEIERYKKIYRKLKLSTTSGQSSSSPTPRQSSDMSNEVLPLRSEGEISLGQFKRKVKKNDKASKSEGEMSLGELLRKVRK